MIEVSAKKIWQADEINLVRNVLSICFKSMSLEETFQLSVRLTDDREIKDLNKMYRKKNEPTNVLSFSSNEGKKDKSVFQVLGDLVISRDTAIRELKNTKKNL